MRNCSYIRGENKKTIKKILRSCSRVKDTKNWTNLTMKCVAKVNKDEFIHNYSLENSNIFLLV